jgi:hypothetical protein
MKVIRQLIDHLTERGVLSLEELAVLRRAGYDASTLTGLPVERLDLSDRTLQGLWRADVTTIGDLLRTSGDRLLANGDLDGESFCELRAALERAELFDKVESLYQTDILRQIAERRSATPAEVGSGAAASWEEHFDGASRRRPQRGGWRWGGRRVPRSTR